MRASPSEPPHIRTYPHAAACSRPESKSAYKKAYKKDKSLEDVDVTRQEKTTKGVHTEQPSAVSTMGQRM